MLPGLQVPPKTVRSMRGREMPFLHPAGNMQRKSLVSFDLHSETPVANEGRASFPDHSVEFLIFRKKLDAKKGGRLIPIRGRESIEIFSLWT